MSSHPARAEAIRECWHAARRAARRSTIRLSMQILLVALRLSLE
jgi:hypothetical protein